MNVTVHHEIPVESILAIIRVVGGYVFEAIAAVALCALLVGILLRWLDSYLGSKIVQIGFDFDDEADIRVGHGPGRPELNLLRGDRDQASVNGSVTEKN